MLGRTYAIFQITNEKGSLQEIDIVNEDHITM